MAAPTAREVERAASLREEIDSHNRQYYVNNISIVDDSQYDKLVLELISLETKFPKLRDSNSPTQRVGGEAASIFLPIEFSVQMLSLDNAFSEDDVIAFDKRVRDRLESSNVPVASLNYVCELKFDG